MEDGDEPGKFPKRPFTILEDTENLADVQAKRLKTNEDRRKNAKHPMSPPNVPVHAHVYNQTSATKTPQN